MKCKLSLFILAILISSSLLGTLAIPFSRGIDYWTVDRNVEPFGSGVINSDPFDMTYADGTTLNLTAIPNEGYEFDYWTRNGVLFSHSYENPYIFQVTTNYVFWAHFSAIDLPPSSSNWTLTGSSGTWDTVDNSISLQTHGDNTGRANFTDIRAPFTEFNATNKGIQMYCNVTVIGDRMQWYWINGVKRFYFALQLHSETTGENVYAMFYIAHEQGIIIKTSEATFGVARKNIGKPFLNIGETADTINGTYAFQMLRTSATEVTVNYGIGADLGNSNFDPSDPNSPWYGGLIVYNENFTVSDGFWNSVTVTLFTGQDGAGLLDATIPSLYAGTITPFHNQLPAAMLPIMNPFNQIINAVWGFFGFIYSLVTMIVAFVGPFLPVLPIFLIMWALDVVITAVNTGNLSLIGDWLLKFFDFARVLWDTIINFGQLVWDAITFWS